MSVPSSFILDTGVLSVSMKRIDVRPAYEIQLSVGGTMNVFHWSGSNMAAGLRALADEIKHLAENVELNE